MMSKPCLTCRHLLFVLLGLWLGMLLAVGAAAAVAFPTMKHLNPTLADFAAVGDHWSIAAGSIFQPIFAIAMKAFLGFAFVAMLLTFASVRGMKTPQRLLTFVAVVVTLGVSGAGVYIEHKMSSNWRQFTAAARAGDAATAMPHRVEFERMHPVASGLLKGETLLVACTIAILLFGCRAKSQAEIAP